MAPRLSNYHIITKYLSSLSNAELTSLLAIAIPIGSGTGGEVLSIKVAGIPVFVKKKFGLQLLKKKTQAQLQTSINYLHFINME